MFFSGTSNQSFLSVDCSVVIQSVSQIPFFQSNPIALVFLLSAIPLVPIPKYEFLLPIITNVSDASGIIIASTLGNIIAELVLYFGIKHGIRYLRRKEIAHDIDAKNFIHEHSILIFIATPFVPFLTDILILYAGYRRVKISHIILPMSIGFALKNYLLVTLVLQGSLNLPHILKMCSLS